MQLYDWEDYDSDDLIDFDPIPHTYTNARTQERYLGVTTFISQFEPEFDMEYWSAREAVKRYYGETSFKYQAFKRAVRRPIKDGNGKIKVADKLIVYNFIERQECKGLILNIQQQVKQEWRTENKIAIDKGSAYHEKQENRLNFNQYRIANSGLINKLASFESIPDTTISRSGKINLSYQLPDGAYAEILMKNHQYKICGQADYAYIETINGIRYIDLDDFKGFALDTPIATETGWKTIGEIEVGDKIFAGNGKLTKVKNVSQIHYNPCYKIKFDSGEELIADHEHKWKVSLAMKGGFYDTIMTTEEMYLSKEKIIKIDCVALNIEHKELPIDPYLLGMWLGNGNRTCGTVCNIYPEVWQELENRGYTISEDHNQNNEGKADSRTIYGLRGELVKLNLLNNKHIPDIYLRASHEQRLDLLRGFMDSDGYYHRERGRCVMATTQIWQAEAFITLTSSLGYKPTMFPYKTSGFGKENIQAYSVCFSPTTENPFLARNTDYLETLSDNKNRKVSKSRYIKEIIPVETVPTKCLEVESMLHTYLVGKTFIRTHNTNKKLTEQNLYDNFISPLQFLQHTKINIYKLQLLLYAWMAKEYGFTIRRLTITHQPDNYREPVIHEIHKFSPNYPDPIKLMLEVRKTQIK